MLEVKNLNFSLYSQFLLLFLRSFLHSPLHQQNERLTLTELSLFEVYQTKDSQTEVSLIEIE